MERPTIDPSSVSPDAPDFFRVPHITVRPQRGPSLSDAAPKASMDGPGPLSEVDARTWRPQSGAPRQYLAADLTTSMGRKFRCPPAVPLTRSLDAFRRDLHRKRDEGAYGSVYARTLRADERAFFKFVLAHPDDLEGVLRIVRTHMIPAQRVFLMPEGTDSATLRSRMEWLVPLCMEHGFRLSDRLHIHLFGDTRGT